MIGWLMDGAGETIGIADEDNRGAEVADRAGMLSACNLAG